MASDSCGSNELAIGCHPPPNSAHENGTFGGVESFSPLGGICSRIRYRFSSEAILKLQKKGIADLQVKLPEGMPGRWLPHCGDSSRLLAVPATPQSVVVSGLAFL